MKFPVDIHTHRLPPVPGTAIANRYPDTFVPEEGAWYSVGIHPWHIPATVTPVVRNEMNVLASLAGHPQVLAIGEAGLDKLADAPMVVQIKVFEYQLKLKQQIKPANPWIIHGFRGKAALAEECLRHGFYLSFGEKYQEEALRITPAGRLFLETDESSVPVADLYSRAAEVRRVSLAELTEAIRENIAKVFFKQ